MTQGFLDDVFLPFDYELKYNFADLSKYEFILKTGSFIRSFHYDPNFSGTLNSTIVFIIFITDSLMN